MKIIKLIIIFVVILGGVIGVLFLLTDGEKDVPAPSSDTNVLSDTTAIGDTAVIEDADDRDSRITDIQDEEEDMAPTKTTRPKHNPVMSPSESKQRKNAALKKEKQQRPERNHKHKYTCGICGPNIWFKTQRELRNHIEALHEE